jgi:mRNA-degrading endonuclease toxin of MazEF toxin-antitoxin module
MTAASPGGVVLIRFVFADETGEKLRPALVVNADAYNEGRQEVIVAAITSNRDRALFGDVAIRSWKPAGLLLPSVVTGIVRTVKRAMVAKSVGALRESDMAQVDAELRRCLSL